MRPIIPEEAGDQVNYVCIGGRHTPARTLLISRTRMPARGNLLLPAAAPAPAAAAVASLRRTILLDPYRDGTRADFPNAAESDLKQEPYILPVLNKVIFYGNILRKNSKKEIYAPGLKCILTPARSAFTFKAGAPHPRIGCRDQWASES